MGVNLRFFLFVTIVVSFFVNDPSYSMGGEQGNPEESEKKPLLNKSPQKQTGESSKGKEKTDYVEVSLENPRENGNEATLRIRSVLVKAKTKVSVNEGIQLNVQEVDPHRISSILIRRPLLQKEEPNHLFLILPPSLKTETEERLDSSGSGKRDVNLMTREERLEHELNKILITGKIQERTALLAYKKVKVSDKSWEDTVAFFKELDKRFFIRNSSSRKVMGAKIVAGIFGLGAPIPLCGIILDSIETIFEFPPAGWLSDSLSVWITTTVAPVAVRQLYKRAGRIFEKEAFVSAEEDESQCQKDPEAGESYRSTPHVFKKSRRHKAACVTLAISSALNSLVPGSLVMTVYQDYDRVTGFPWGPILAPFVAVHYAENYYAFGVERLWESFSYYSYIGSGQTGEEDSRKKRQILKARMQQFQNIIANPKFNEYVKKVFEEIERQKKLRSEQNSLNLTEDMDISAFSLLMLMDKIRAEEAEQGYGAINFKKDLDVIKASWIEDAIDYVVTGIVGAAYFADTAIIATIIRDSLNKFFQNVLHFDPVTSAELAGSYTAAFFDTSFRASIEVKLHQTNIKSWIKAFSLNHLVDFRWLRKGSGLISSVANPALHSLPKLCVGWSVFQGYPLLGKLAILIPSAITNFSLNQVIFNRHYDGLITDIVTLKTQDIGTERQRAHLKALSDRAIQLIETRFDDETIDKIVFGIHKSN